jgi:hypothetical protein
MKHNLKETPIVFMSEKEEFEAIKLGVMEVMFAGGEYPVIRVDREIFYPVILDEEYIKLLQKSVLWVDIREQYLPKPWYLQRGNFGKPIYFYDDDVTDGDINRFEYFKDGVFYSTNGRGWRNARPLTEEDIRLFGDLNV